MCYRSLLIAVLATSLHLSGAQGFHVQMNSTIQCSPCGPGSPSDCLDCSVPVGQHVQITCIFVGDCDPFSHPLRMLRITDSGPMQIKLDDTEVPGFVDLTRPTDCSLRLNFTATLAANNMVIQCGVSTNEVMEYSLAKLISIRDDTPVASVPSHGNPTQPSPSPSSTSSSSSSSASSSSSTTSSTRTITSSSVTSTSKPTKLPTPSSVSDDLDGLCVCSTSLPSSGAGSKTNSMILELSLSLSLVMAYVLCL